MSKTTTLQKVLVALPVLAALLAGCDEDDIGKPCEPQGSTVALTNEAVGGEDAVVEVVSVERNGACESFQCLTHRGYPSYCTRTCVVDEKVGKDCDDHFDCGKSMQCLEGKCRESDCPAGFVCEGVQPTGDNRAQSYCVRKEGCDSNFDCEDLSNLFCEHLGCVDERLLTADPDGAPRLVCVDRAKELGFCTCPGGGEDCVDAALTCTPENASEPWPAGSVERRNACQRKAQ